MSLLLSLDTLKTDYDCFTTKVITLQVDMLQLFTKMAQVKDSDLGQCDTVCLKQNMGSY